MIILDACRPQYITFSGYGEPLLNPELADMIREARRRGTVLNTTTNGVLLSEQASALLTAGISLINVSLDAADPSVHRAVRGSEVHAAVLDGIRRCRQLRDDARHRCHLRVSKVLHPTLLDDLPAFLQLVHELGVDSVLFQPYEPPADSDSAGAVMPGPDALRAKLTEAAQLARQMHVRANLAALLRDLPETWATKYARGLNARPCKVVWFSVYVTAGGDVRPCCAFAPSDYAWGNLFTAPLAEILRQPPAVAFREQLRQGQRPHPVCRQCVPISYREIFLPSYARF